MNSRKHGFHLFITKCFFAYLREVFKARDRKSRAVVAMKKVLMENEKEGVRQNTIYYVQLCELN